MTKPTHKTPTGRPPKHNPQAALDAYRAFRASGSGSDRDFIYHQTLSPPVSETWLRRSLALWRERASKHLDPITGLPLQSPQDAQSLIEELGQAAPEPEVFAKAKAEEKALLSAEPEGAALQTVKSIQERRILRAQRVMDKLLAGRPVKPLQHKAAVAVLETAGLLGKPRLDPNKNRVSEFTGWPTVALVELLNELGTMALATRHDPVPPAIVVPAEERDAARLEEPSGQQAPR